MVSEDDLVDVMKQLRADKKGWVADAVEVEKYSAIIAAAWEVMRKKHADTLADAVLESMQSGCLVEFFEGTTTGAIVRVTALRKPSVTRHVSSDNNFAALATAAVRQLSQQVRQ